MVLSLAGSLDFRLFNNSPFRTICHWFLGRANGIVLGAVDGVLLGEDLEGGIVLAKDPGPR